MYVGMVYLLYILECTLYIQQTYDAQFLKKIQWKIQLLNFQLTNIYGLQISGSSCQHICKIIGTFVITDTKSFQRKVWIEHGVHLIIKI